MKKLALNADNGSMCGRYALYAEMNIVAAAFEIPEYPLFEPRYNIAPTQPVLACRLDPGRGVREFAHLRWGLIPSWAKDESAGVKAINARAEIILTKHKVSREVKKDFGCTFTEDV